MGNQFTKEKSFTVRTWHSTVELKLVKDLRHFDLVRKEIKLVRVASKLKRVFSNQARDDFFHFLPEEDKLFLFSIHKGKVCLFRWRDN